MPTSLTGKLFATVGAVLVALSLAGATAPALAAGGGASGDTPKCKDGMVYDKPKGICVKADSGLDDKYLIDQGRAVALAGQYENALTILAAVNDKTDPILLTYLGYANRKLGRVDAGIAYYHQALAIDPGNLNTREYLGEGYVAAGRTDLAVAELNKLEALCGTGCDQYEQLELAIAGAPERWQ